MSRARVPLAASTLILLGLLAPAGTVAAGGSDGRFDELFTGQTMRLDYHHTGTATEA